MENPADGTEKAAGQMDLNSSFRRKSRQQQHMNSKARPVALGDATSTQLIDAQRRQIRGDPLTPPFQRSMKYEA